MRRDLLRVAVLLAWCIGTIPLAAEAQYFGQNKVQHRNFEFSVLETAHFDIYYYPEEADAARHVGRMAERWYARLSVSLGYPLTGRQAVVLYASHPEFRQTNVIEGEISEGVGGVTESGRRRIVLPMGASLADTDHVLGHELVHAFQYDLLGRQAGAMPLWMIEGMAEYLSIGARDPQTAVWLRDAAYQNRLPTLKDLDNPDVFPYRYGHAFWAYVTGRWGDRAIVHILQFIVEQNGMGDPIKAVEAVTGMDHQSFSAAWHTAIREAYDIGTSGIRPEDVGGVVIGKRTDRGRLDVGPSLSPDGQRVAFLSERGRLSIDLYLADANTGQVIRRLVSTAADPHFDSLQFLASAGTWAPDGGRLAVAVIQNGKAAIAIFDASSGDRVDEIDFPQVGEIFQPAWSPDGKSIAFVGQAGGFTDLYLYDLPSRQTRRLTEDAYADLQPAWSADGRRLAFVTERFSTDLESLDIGDMQLATLTIADGRAVRLPTSLAGNATNPQWSPDNRWIYFVSDADGRPNAYRADAATGESARVTAAVTGIGGVTRNSPSISVAASGDRMAVTVFRDSGYEIHVLDAPSAIASLPTLEGDQARLPPLTRTNDIVTALLRATREGLPAADAFTTRKYRPRLALTTVSQGAGVATSQFGTFVSGGIALGFTDPLGEHLLGTAVAINGGFKDFGASATYVNRTRQWNWGVFGERAPLVSGTAAAGFATVDGEAVYVEQTELFRQTVTHAGAFVAYPFTRASRLEFSGRVQRIGFDREVNTLIFDPTSGALLSDQTETLPTAPSLRLTDASAAWVRDTSVFGATAPLIGQRMRVEVAQTFGDLQFTTLTADVRHYAMPFRPVTFAGQLLHIGRYGASGEDPRLFPLFLGYPSLVRGYEAQSFNANECAVVSDGSCPEFDRLAGSRILVAKGEVRAPLVGLFTGSLNYGPIPVDLIAFGDAGLAWTGTESPVFAGGTRGWVTSVGVGARFNLFGVLIGEVDIIRPLNRRGRGFGWAFNFITGF